MMSNLKKIITAIFIGPAVTSAKFGRMLGIQPPQTLLAHVDSLSRHKGGPIFVQHQIGKSRLMVMLPLAFLIVILSSAAEAAMTEMKDSELSDVAGQALMQMTKTPGQGVSSNMTFYEAGLDAVLELNMNIEKLQLGCGGINGPGGCDIDIDNFSLHGLPGANGCPETGNTVGCNAILTRPSFSFAIANDDSKTLRSVEGVMLSAEDMSAQLTAGKNDGTANGINRMSGFFNINEGPGYAVTAPNYIDISGGRLQVPINAQLCGFLGCVTVGRGTATSNSGNLVIPGIGDPNNPETGVPFTMPSFSYYGYRGTTSGPATQAGTPDGNTVAFIDNITANLPDIPLDAICASDPGACGSNGGQNYQGPSSLTATVYGIPITVDAYLRGTVTDLKANFSLTEPLGFFHVIPVESSPMQLSFQSQSIRWPGQTDAHHSQRGWFMYLSDPLTITDEENPLTTPIGTAVDIKTAQNDQSLIDAVNNYFAANPIDVDAGQAVFTGQSWIDLGPQDFGDNPAVPLGLSGLPLGDTQTPPQNCYGSYQFC